MSVVDPRSHAVVALTNRIVDVGVAPLRASELWALLAEVPDPTELVGQPASAITEALRSTPEHGVRIAALLDSGVALAVQLAALADRGIWAITPFDAAYPSVLRDRLGAGAPPVLYGAGELALLARRGIGVAGSGDVTEEEAEVVRAAAQLATDQGVPVVTGGARGIDHGAMDAAHAADGTAVGVLADPLEQAISRADTRRALIDGQLCLCTPYPPNARYSERNAMGRSKIIYALSQVTLVVATDAASDSTWTGAAEALDKDHGTVAVWRGPGEGPANAALERRGAGGITSMSDLLSVKSSAVQAPTTEQLSLLHPPSSP